MTILDFALICSSIEPVIMSFKNSISWTHKLFIWAIWLAAVLATILLRDTVPIEVWFALWVFVMPFLILLAFKFFKAKSSF